MAWPLTGSPLAKYNRLLSDLRQYGTFYFIGSPDDITFLWEIIRSASDGALSPELDDVANRPVFWMLTLATFLGDQIVAATPCPECPPVIPCPPCPDPRITTTPPGLEDEFGVFAYTDIPSLTDVVMHSTSIGEGIDIQNQTGLVSVSAPDLIILDTAIVTVSFDPVFTSFSLPALTTMDNAAGILVSDDSAFTSFSLPVLTMLDNNSSVGVSNNPALTVFDLPALTTVDNGSSIQVNNNSTFTSFSLPSLTTVANSAFIQVTGNVSLTAVSFVNVIFGNGIDLFFSDNALTDVSVNHILARGVASALYASGTVDLSLGANSAPTGQGIADKATLIARGVTVVTN